MSSLKNITKTVLAIVLCTAAMSSRAQLNPFQSIYHQNPYIYNPSMAGVDNALNINLNYRQQWSSFPGTPKTTSFTLDFQPADRVGLGINVNDDQAGLIRQTRIMGTYAYHLPLNESQHLHFGLSLGMDDSRVDYTKVIGDLTDEEISLYNRLKPYVDGDFGIAYTDKRFYIGSALPNLKTIFFKNSDDRFDADRMLFIAMASYKIPFQDENRSFILEPLAAYRVVKGYNNIVDAGFIFTLNNYGLYMQSIYHSSRSLGVGFGLDQDTYALNLSYNVETGALSTYTTGAFELGIKVRMFKK